MDKQFLRMFRDKISKYIILKIRFPLHQADMIWNKHVHLHNKLDKYLNYVIEAI